MNTNTYPQTNIQTPGTETSETKIGLVSAIIISMNAMIGAGIFTTPAQLAHSVGPAGILTYIFVIIAVLFIALSLSFVAQRYPQAGSFYTYARQWGGHTVGIIMAGIYTLGVSIALGLVAQAAASYIHEYIPTISTTHIGLGLIASIVLLNSIGVRFMQAGQVILLGCTIFALLGTTLVCLFHAQPSNLVPFMPHGLQSVLAASPTAIFAFLGFESAASLITIVKNPERTVPRALVYSILAVGALYLAFISSIAFAIPAQYFTTDKTSIAQALVQAFPSYSWLSKIIGIVTITALLGVLQSMLYSVSTLIRSFLQYTHSRAIQQFVRSEHSFSIILVLLGAFVGSIFLSIESMGLFFKLTALCVVTAYASAIVTVLLKPQEFSRTQKCIALLGLVTAGMIFYTALSGILSSF